MQTTAPVACREMGFASGFFKSADATEAVLPPWLSSIRCNGSEQELSGCDRSTFGDTSTCEATLRLFCHGGGTLLFIFRYRPAVSACMYGNDMLWMEHQCVRMPLYMNDQENCMPALSRRPGLLHQ